MLKKVAVRSRLDRVVLNSIFFLTAIEFTNAKPNTSSLYYFRPSASVLKGIKRFSRTPAVVRHRAI